MIPRAKAFLAERRGLCLCLLAAAASVFLALTSCANTVTPPGDVAEPVEVILIDHGHHASLVLPGEGEEMVRWVYGDWSWYARWRHGSVNAVKALFLPSQATLGREALPATVTLETVDAHLSVLVEEKWAFAVERERALELQRELEHLHSERLDDAVVNELFSLTFVPHPSRYHLFNNCNHRLADWLARLGCDIGGFALLSRWRVEQSTPESPPDTQPEN